MLRMSYSLHSHRIRRFALCLFQDGAESPWIRLDVLFQRVAGDERQELLEAALREIAERLLTAAEYHVELDAMTSLEEVRRLRCGSFEIVARRLQVNTEHLDLRGVLFRPVFALLLGFGVFELAEVHDFYDRGARVRSDLNHIEPLFLREVEGLLERYFPEVLAVFINGADQG